MALNPQRREDLIRDARQFPQRALFRVMCSSTTSLADMVLATEQVEVFVGVRSSGGWSIYFGEDPVLQFNERNELRRLYFAGVRYAAVSGRLELLHRAERGGRVVFERQVLEPERERELLDVCQGLVGMMVPKLDSFLSARNEDEISLVSQISEPSEDWLEHLLARVAATADELVVAASVH